MNCVVQWATILSPIIAIIIAWVAVRSSAKDTAKKIAALAESTRDQIAALEQSTAKQVESIKELTMTQLDVTLLQIDKELWDLRYRLRYHSQEAFDDLNIQDQAYQLGIPKDKYSKIIKKEYDFKRESELLMKQLDNLESIKSRLKKMVNEKGGM